MPTAPITRYHGRLNTAPDPDRKEWRRVGRPALVVNGGTVTPGTTLAVTLTASPSSPSVGQTVTLTATTTGGVPPYVRTFSQVSGDSVTLSGTGGTTRTFVPNTSGSRTFRIRAVDDEGSSQEATVTVATQGAPLGQPLYAGHIPGRVIVGYASNASTSGPRPEWKEARSIIQARSQQVVGTAGVAAYEWRIFTATQTRGNDIAELRGLLARCDDVNVLPWISCKVVGNDWLGVANGNYPAIPAMWRQLAAERRASGKGPFLATMHHEPRGDGDIAHWALMQTYMSNQVVEYNDIMAWSAIGNGWLWNQVVPPSNLAYDRTSTFPQVMLDTFRVNKHLIAVDSYDDGHPVYTGQETTPSGLGTRVSVKLTNWINDMRARNAGGLGIGEWSTMDGQEVARVWELFRSNRDILGVTNYYNSIQGGSKWDWRMIPADYPDYNGNEVDFGGTALTDARLTEYVKLLAASTTAANTGPL